MDPGVVKEARGGDSGEPEGPPDFARSWIAAELLRPRSVCHRGWRDTPDHRDWLRARGPHVARLSAEALRPSRRSAGRERLARGEQAPARFGGELAIRVAVAIPR